MVAVAFGLVQGLQAVAVLVQQLALLALLFQPGDPVLRLVRPGLGPRQAIIGRLEGLVLSLNGLVIDGLTCTFLDLALVASLGLRLHFTGLDQTFIRLSGFTVRRGQLFVQVVGLQSQHRLQLLIAHIAKPGLAQD